VAAAARRGATGGFPLPFQRSAGASAEISRPGLRRWGRGRRRAGFLAAPVILTGPVGATVAGTVPRVDEAICGEEMVGGGLGRGGRNSARIEFRSLAELYFVSCRCRCPDLTKCTSLFPFVGCNVVL
jgi:hypothetical protein